MAHFSVGPTTKAGEQADSQQGQRNATGVDKPGSPAVGVHRGDTLPQKSLFQLINISIGFLGIQFAWAIQMGQMGPLLDSFNLSPEVIGRIMIAGPVTGVLVQPIVGALSDACKSKYGRRRPFLLIGAILTAISLIWMPNSHHWLVAAALLWVLDASINTMQGPYRAIVPDVVPHNQHAKAYALMSLTIGLGSVASFLIGYAINNMHMLFYVGAFSMLAAMTWTLVTTPELPPVAAADNAVETQPQRRSPIETLVGFITSTTASIVQMPMEAKKLCLAHSFTWFGLGCLFFYFSLFVPRIVYGADSPTSPLYAQAGQWVMLSYALKNTVCFGFSTLIGRLCDLTSKKAVHTFGLLCMAGGLIGMFMEPTPTVVMIMMGLFGIGWATTLSIPFALLSEHIPSGQEGVLMGAFNIFIAAPQVLSGIAVGAVIHNAGDNYGVAMLIGGAAMLVAALMLQWVHEREKEIPVHAH